MRRLALGFTFVAGCATTSSPSSTAAPPVAAGRSADARGAVRIVDARYGREHSVSSEEMTIPFGPNQNGNELVVAALERARARGASYVGDLAITMTFRWGGTPIECRTQVRFEHDPEDHAAVVAPAPVLPASAGPQYGTEVEKFRPAKEAFVAEDRELACAREATAVSSDGTAGEQRLGAAAGGTARGGRVDTAEECSWRDVTRNAERYDYEGKVGFVPPNWAHLAERFAAGRLVPVEPSCYSIEEAELRKASPYRLTAVAYHRADAPRPGEARESGLPRRDPPRSIVPESVQQKLDRNPDQSRTRRDPLEVERDAPR